MATAPTLRKYDLYHALWKSFYSQEFYHDVAYQWRGTCLGYLLLLICLTTGVFCIKMDTSWKMVFQTQITPLLHQIPEMKIEDGKITTFQPGRYEIHDIVNHHLIAVIDTSSPELPKDNLNSPALISQDKIRVTYTVEGLIVRFVSLLVLEQKVSQNDNPDHSTVISPLPEVKLTLDQAFDREWLVDFQRTLIPVMIFFIFLGNIFRLVILAFLLSLTARNFQRGLGMTLDYVSTLRITIIAMTPAILLEVLLSALSIYDPMVSILSLAVMILSVTMAFISIREPLSPDDDNDNDADIF